MKPKTLNLIKHLALALCLGLFGIATASGQSTRIWQLGTSAPFSGVGNGWNTVPVAGDVARFGRTGLDQYPVNSAFTVNLVGNVTNGYIRLNQVNAFTMTLDLAGYTYEATSNGGSTSGSVVGRDTGDTNTLILTSSAAGGAFTSNGLYVGRIADTVGVVSVQGGNTTMNLNTTIAQIGMAGVGTLEIKDGAKLNSTAEVQAGTGVSGQGTILIDGTGSKWTTNSEVRISASSTSAGFLTVTNGGVLENTATGSNGNINFATVAGSTATVLVEDGGQIIAGGSLNIGGRLTTTGGTANVTVGQGGSLQAAALRIYSGGTLLIDGGIASATNLLGSTVPAGMSGEIALTLYNTNPLITIASTVTLDSSLSNLTLSLGTGASYAVNDEIFLIRYGTLNGTFSNYTEGQTFQLGNYDVQFSYALSSGGNNFIGLTVLSVIPEPSTGLLFGLALLVAAGGRKLRGLRK